MPEPIAVAFVEVRPETDTFRSNAESEIREGLGPDGLAVKGDFQLAGLAEAKRDVGTLTSDLRAVSGQQLQFDGLEDAGVQAGELARGLETAASVDLTGNLQPAASAAGALATQADALATSIAGIPEAVGPDLAAGLEEATADVALLAAQTQQLGDSLGTAETAAAGLGTQQAGLIATERQLAQMTAEQTQQVRLSANEEEKLIRVRSRRAQTVGPFRLAGIGLGVGTAIFAATRAVGELSAGLAVGGNEALTFEGRMRNLGASLLSGDVLGAFRALNTTTRDYTATQVVAIDTSNELADALKQAGIALDEIAGLAESRLAAVEGFVQVPQFLQTRLAEAQFSGDDAGQVAALEEADRILTDRLKTIRELNLTQGQTNAALEEVFRQRKTIADQIAAITGQARPDILAPLVEAVTSARLTGDSGKILAALRREQGELQKVIAAEQTNAADRRRFKDELLKVNKDIEATQDQVVAEELRHRQAMLDKTLDIGVLEDLESEAAGGSSTAGRSQRAAAIRATLERGTLDGKRLTRDEKERLNAELVSINSEIESEQQAIIDEQERHADEMKRLADEAVADLQRKNDEADASFIRALGIEGGKQRNAELRAASTAGLADDIRTSERIQADLRESIAAARRTIHDAELKADTVAQLTASLEAEQRDERTLRRQQRQERISRREESLDLDIQIAQANDNTNAELRAHRAKVKFLQERIRHTREGTNQRKRLILELRQEQAAIRELLEEGKKTAEEGDNFAEQAFAFLQAQQGFAAELAGNLLPTGQPPPRTSTTQPPPQSPPVSGSSPTTSTITSPFERPFRESGGNQALAATALRETAGAPASQGQLEVLINLSRRTNNLLGDIRTGIGHGEAKAQRALSRNAVEVGVD